MMTCGFRLMLDPHNSSPQPSLLEKYPYFCDGARFFSHYVEHLPLFTLLCSFHWLCSLFSVFESYAVPKSDCCIISFCSDTVWTNDQRQLMPSDQRRLRNNIFRRKFPHFALVQSRPGRTLLSQGRVSKALRPFPIGSRHFSPLCLRAW